MKYMLCKQTVKWTENWFDCWAQGAVISGMKAIWRLVTQCAQGVRLVKTSLMTSDNGTECILSKFAIDTILERVADTSDRHLSSTTSVLSFSRGKGEKI